NNYKILYIAPERLDAQEFIELINNNNVSQVAIDEAHCVSQWGASGNAPIPTLSITIQITLLI
ncbi:hypothetical protein ACTPD5_21955, partial [Clostridioides difficile]|uniref:hypothetical protein n=1 Tax=Clostridioides difficile TaxID=1496 RepID=UPI003F8D6FFC